MNLFKIIFMLSIVFSMTSGFFFNLKCRGYWFYWDCNFKGKPITTISATSSTTARTNFGENQIDLRNRNNGSFNDNPPKFGPV
jgi:hypothetical protein